MCRQDWQRRSLAQILSISAVTNLLPAEDKLLSKKCRYEWVFWITNIKLKLIQGV